MQKYSPNENNHKNYSSYTHYYLKILTYQYNKLLKEAFESEMIMESGRARVLRLLGWKIERQMTLY